MKRSTKLAFMASLLAGMCVCGCEIDTGLTWGDNNNNEVCLNGDDRIGVIKNVETEQQVECKGVSCNLKENKCGECKNNDNKCEKRDDGYTKVRCDDGKWNDIGHCVVECKNGVNGENGENGENEIGVIKIKETGEVIENCKNEDSDVSCHDNSCGECLNNEHNCEDGKRYRCEKGQWKYVEECKNVVCENVGEKKIGKIKEEGKPDIVCENVSCHDNACGECLNDEHNCVGENNRVCENGRWKDAGKCGESDCINDKDSKVGKKDGKNCQDDEKNDVSCRDNKNCGDCLNGKYKCEGVGNERKVCEQGEWKPSEKCECDKIGTISGDKKRLCIDYKWMKCSNWGDVVENRACLYKNEKLWYECNASEEKKGPAVDDKLLCNKNVWYECKSDAHLNAVVDKMACVKNDNVYKWTECKNTDEAKGRENDDKILCNGIDWKVCEKSEIFECVRKSGTNREYGKLYSCDGNKWSDKTCDVECKTCN